jgi:DNA polymerase-3 subunit alpha
MDDEKTLGLLNRGDTIGVFQVESKGMRDLLRRIGLDRFEDLIAMIALYRPGPMNMLDDFVKRKHGRVNIQYDHPLLETILQETYGVMLYQEQVQQAANLLAGFSLGQGDILRRAMGKKNPDEMASQRDKFVDGCLATNQIPKAVAGKIFDNIEQFAGYGFNKSHSAAYAILSYQTAYLKAHHPAEFMAALMSSEMGNTDKLPVFIAEAREMGLPVLPPCVNESLVRFTPVTDGIRFGMAGVKNVGVGAVEAIVAERKASGPFLGLMDFCTRVDSQSCNKKVLESLIKCGAFDFCGMSRGMLFENIDFAMSRASSAQRDRASGQGNLFDMLEPSETTETEELPHYPPWPESMMLAAEKELLGFYISGHPLQQFEWELRTYNLVDPSTLDDVEPGTLVRLGGLVDQFLKRFTKKTQEPMCVFRLEFLEGSAEVVCFPDAYRTCDPFLANDVPVMVCGELDKEEGSIRIKAAEVYPLPDVPKLFTQKFSLHIPAATTDDRKLESVRDIVRRHPGQTNLTICLEFAGGEKVFVGADCSFTVQPNTALIHELEHVLGEDSVYVAVNRAPLLRPRKQRQWGNGGGRRGQ